MWKLGKWNKLFIHHDLYKYVLYTEFKSMEEKFSAVMQEAQILKMSSPSHSPTT